MYQLLYRLAECAQNNNVRLGQRILFVVINSSDVERVEDVGE